MRSYSLEFIERTFGVQSAPEYEASHISSNNFTSSDSKHQTSLGVQAERTGRPSQLRLHYTPLNEATEERRVDLVFSAKTQGGQATKPPRSSTGLPPADGLATAGAGADRKQSLGAGTEVDGASDVAVVQHDHTCDRASPELARAGPITLAAYGTSAAAAAPGSLGSQKHNRGNADAELGQEATMRDLSTPLASAGAGDVGAECEATPLQSRPPRGASRSQGSCTLASLLGGGGGGPEAASEEAASASGVESSSNGEGREVLKRKDTITWESFLANMSVSDGAKGEGRATAAASASDSSSPVDTSLPGETPSEPPTAPVSSVWFLVYCCHAPFFSSASLLDEITLVPLQPRSRSANSDVRTGRARCLHHQHVGARYSINFNFHAVTKS